MALPFQRPHGGGGGGVRAPARALLVLGAALRAGCVELRSWEEAQAMADQKLITMTAYERHLLMKGIGWTPNPAGPNLFPVLQDGMYMGNTPAIPRLGIPALKLHDAGNGFRNNPMGGIKAYGTATSFPSALCLASTWDDGIVSRSARAIGEEFKAKGSNVILGPGVQVHRVQRNGRNFEYLSGEDPYLGARLSFAYTEAVQSAGVIGCAKHWAFNEQEISRMDSSSDVDEKTAWEIYYPPFEAAVKAGIGSFMCGYNKVNGTYDCENEKLLKIDLKGKMGFNGFVMSDWFATHSPSVKQGLDQMMPGVEGWFAHEVLECMETGQGCDFSQKEPSMMDKVMGVFQTPKDPNAPDPPGLQRDFSMRDAARRILAAIYKLRLEETPGCNPGPECVPIITMSVRSPSHDKVALEGATQGVVLLKNAGSLPIDANSIKSIFVAGWVDPDPLHEGAGMPPGDYYSGGGSGHTSAEPWHVSKPIDAIRKRARQAGITEVKSQPVFGPFDHTKFFKSAREADLRIYVGATTSSEGDDRPTMFLDMYGDQMIGYMAEAGPTVVLLMTPGVTVMPWRNHPNITGILHMFLGGEKTGAAFASTLFGDVTPAGKLPIMLLKTHEGEVPPSQDKIIPYREGMFGSYRSDKANDIAAYPFGFGLSYTTFGYGTPKQVALSECQGATHAWKGASPLQACVVVEVKNTGKYKGAEVAQAYVEFPADARMPKIMLKGFHKTAVLEPGAAEVAKFLFTKRDLSIYDVGSEKWVLQETVQLHVGASSADFRGSLEVSASGPKETKPARGAEL